MNSLSPFCYICLKNSNNLRNIDCFDADDICIKDKLNFCVFMQEKTYYKIPLYICQTCHKKLNIAFYFREMGLKSNDILNEYVTQFSDNSYNQLKNDFKDINEQSDKSDERNVDYNNTSDNKYNNGSVATSLTNNLDTNPFQCTTRFENIKSNNQPKTEINEEIIDVSLTSIKSKDTAQTNQHYLGNIFENNIKTEIFDTSDIETVILEYSDKSDVGNTLIKDLETVVTSESSTDVNINKINDSFQEVERELEKMFTDSSENINQSNMENICQSSRENNNQFKMEDNNQLKMEDNNQLKMEDNNQFNTECVDEFYTEKLNDNSNELIDISDDEFFDESDKISDNILQNNLRCNICKVVFENEISLTWHLQIHESILAFKESQKNSIKTEINTYKCFL